MEIYEIDVRPRKISNKRYTLDQITYFEERVPNMPWLRKSKKKLWPPIKQDNGLGMRFNSFMLAMKYFNEHRDPSVAYGERTNYRLERLERWELITNQEDLRKRESST